MKQTIRFNTFETNSSTTHNIVIIPDKYYEQFDNNQVCYMANHWGVPEQYRDTFKEGFFYTVDEIKNSPWFEERFKEFLADEHEEYDEEDLTDSYYLYRFLYDCGFVTSESIENGDLETDETEYTTESGEKIHIICSYGYDG